MQGLVCGGLLLFASGASCRQPAGPAPQYLGDTRGGRVVGVDPASRVGQAWAELLQARAVDPASGDVAIMAHALLAADPPVGARLAAWAALAQQSFEVGDDAAAVAWADTGLTTIDPADLPKSADARALHADLSLTRVMGLARGGDPTLALAALEDATVAAGLEEDARLGLRAQALDRNADRAAAAVAYVQWRQTLPDEDPSAAWAEHRARVLARSVGVSQLEEAMVGLPPSGARACLEARMGGEAPGSEHAAWVQRCATAVERIGILLPRSGPLSALADQQLIATAAAADVLGARHGAVQIVWEDPGSSEAGTRKAIVALRSRGAEVIVGPIGPKLVAAAASEIGEALALVVPGEGSGVARGVAPSLEARVEALVAMAKKRGKTRLVVLVPDNAYGRRASAAARKSAEGMSDEVVVRSYDAATTSFANTLKPITTALSDRAAVFIADNMARSELIVRQLARLGKVPARGTDSGLMVMTTAEGASQTALSRAGEVFEGVWASPVATTAVAGAGGERFARAYARLADELPGDQAMLVYYAMHMAFTGRAAKGSGKAPLVRVVEGEFVAGSAAPSG